MGNGSTLRLPVPGPPAGRQRRRGGAWIFFVSVLVLVALLAALDRAAVAYADNRAAQQIKAQGFPVKPDVTIEGFPFLTQVASRRLNHVHITASHVREGPVTFSMVADATGVLLNPGFRSGTITHVTGTGLVGFSSLASAAGVAGAPGLKIRADGRHQVKLQVNLDVFSAAAVAAIERAGPDTFRVRIVSADGLPASLLGALRDFTVHIPALPMGLSIQRVDVSNRGVLIHVTGSDIKFG